MIKGSGIFSALPSSGLLDVHPVRRRRPAIVRAKNLTAVVSTDRALPDNAYTNNVRREHTHA